MKRRKINIPDPTYDIGTEVIAQWHNVRKDMWEKAYVTQADFYLTDPARRTKDHVGHWMYRVRLAKRRQGEVDIFRWLSVDRIKSIWQA